MCVVAECRRGVRFVAGNIVLVVMERCDDISIIVYVNMYRNCEIFTFLSIDMEKMY